MSVDDEFDFMTFTSHERKSLLAMLSRGNCGKTGALGTSVGAFSLLTNSGKFSVIGRLVQSD